MYSSDKYLQPLVLGDTWLAVGWSTDILSLTKRYSNIGIAVPQSGTSLWADVWVKPRQKNNAPTNEVISSLLETWIDFCWKSKSAKQILLFTDAISPIFTANNTQDISENIENSPILKSTLATFDNSEFLSPLGAETTTDYLNLWKQIRS